MLIDYSIRAYELLERKLTTAEKTEVFHVFYRVGHPMGLADLPYTFEVWLQMRNKHLEQNLMYSKYTKDLFSQYRKLFGMFRFLLMLVAQALILPQILRMLMGFRKMPL